METKEFARLVPDIKYAGIHRLTKLRKARYLNSLGKIKQISRYFLKACNTALLDIGLNKCTLGAEISSLNFLKKSHISISTWPEHKTYPAIAKFAYGTIDVYKAKSVIKGVLSLENPSGGG